MDWESIGQQFEPKPKVRMLISIDTTNGQMRSYTAADHGAPKLQQVAEFKPEQGDGR